MRLFMMQSSKAPKDAELVFFHIILCIINLCSCTSANDSLSTNSTASLGIDCLNIGRVGGSHYFQK